MLGARPVFRTSPCSTSALGAFSAKRLTSSQPLREFSEKKQEKAKLRTAGIFRTRSDGVPEYVNENGVRLEVDRSRAFYSAAMAPERARLIRRLAGAESVLVMCVMLRQPSNSVRAGSNDGPGCYSLCKGSTIRRVPLYRLPLVFVLEKEALS
eukprot:TRINITY_DN34916_c0_g1_i2.p1 TRINITY_DN34916_c0_g1~~TRINITY_DN34916_c0_g1_i2.p1  ORF type:complete len:153 (-),score=2.74 TRINITY_DN34916_c0_g1_i2:189-647(-)